MAVSKRKKGLKVWFDAGDVRYLIEAFNLPQTISEQMNDRELANVLQSNILATVKGQPLVKAEGSKAVAVELETVSQPEPVAVEPQVDKKRIPDNPWDSSNEDDED